MPVRRTHALRALLAVLAATVLAASTTPASAGGLFFRSRAVGGVAITTDGVLSNALVDDQLRLAAVRSDEVVQPEKDMKAFNPLRKVSLRRLQEAIVDHRKQGRPLPVEINFLAGLQEIRYVLVYPEQNDIVLVGPAEGWEINRDGTVVGRTTGKPTLTLDDFLVALRTADRAARGGISCSIDPTEQGLKQLQALVKQLRTIGNPSVTAKKMEQALGPQRVSIHNAPDTSHFARVLVAADYQMKRLAMDLDKSPVRGLPSFMQLAKASGRGLSNMMPRWWLVPDYEAVVRDTEGITWELRGGGVRCETESDFLAQGGNVQRGAKVDPTAQKWAELFSEKYAELSEKDPIFGELRNCMELAIVGAIISKERLQEKSGLNLGVLLDETVLEIDKFPAPKQVHSQASLLKKGSNWLISVSGGVQLNSWQVASKAETSSTLAPMRSMFEAPKEPRWWWD